MHGYCNIRSGTYKGVDGQEGSGVGSEGWAAGGRLYSLLGPLGLAMSPRSASQRTTHALRA